MERSLSADLPASSGTVFERTLDAARWSSLIAVVAVGAMVPWYTLRTLPPVTIGSAKVNILDCLVAVTVLLALPRIGAGIGSRRSSLLWVGAFMTYMIVPFVTGLSNPDGRFYVIREARPLAFYALALVCATGEYRPRHYRILAAVYVAGTVAAAAAVAAHVYFGVPLPGYEDQALAARFSGLQTILVRYLDWTTTAVAFLLGFAGLVSARSRLGLVVFALLLLPLFWYVLAAAERFVQVIVVLLAIVMAVLPRWRSPGYRLAVAIGVAVVILAVLGVSSMGPSRRLHTAFQYSSDRWGNVRVDDALTGRIREVLAGLPVVERNPLFGGGLGTATPYVWDPPVASTTRSIASGYGYLLIDTGLIGLFLYVGMIASTIRFGWRRRAPLAGDEWPAALVGVIGLTTLSVLNVLHRVVGIPEGAIAFSLFFGMIMSSSGSRGLSVS